MVLKMLSRDAGWMVIARARNRNVGSLLNGREGMYLFTIRSRINPKSKASEQFRDAGGAYVNCYISFKDFAAAEKLAKLLIREEGWIPEQRTDAWKIQKKQLRTKKEKQYYSEAIKYGYSLVFNMWRKDAKDAAVDYERNGEK
jgi:hypothetical protein